MPAIGAAALLAAGCYHEWDQYRPLDDPRTGASEGNSRRYDGDSGATSSTGASGSSGAGGLGGADPGGGDGGSGAGGSAIPCAGVVVAGGCWYIGALGESCEAVCAPHGGYSFDTKIITGTPAQGGSIAGCADVLRALGVPGEVFVGFRDDGLGLGCHVWSDGQPWWLDTPVVDPVSAAGPASRVCGCEQ